MRRRSGLSKIKTPLLPNALEGAVYLASQNENPFGSLIAMYMMVEDPVSGSTVKLAGEVRLCESTGRTLDNVTLSGAGPDRRRRSRTPQICRSKNSNCTSLVANARRSPPRRAAERTRRRRCSRPGTATLRWRPPRSFQIEHGPERGAVPRCEPTVRPVADGGHDEHPGGWVQPIHDDDVARGWPAESAGDHA